MDTFRKYLKRIQAQLAGLTVSQKLLIMLLVVVMIGTIFITVWASAKTEMVVLMPQSMSPEDINRVEMALKGRYEYQVSGDKILVPAEKAYAIRGELFAEQALPKDTTQAIGKLIESSNPFKTDAEASRQWNYALQETLTKMLRYFPYIEDGTVLIARGEKASIGRESVPSSATVVVKVRNNEGLTGNQVLAVVDMVRGAVPGLKREDVHLSDGMRTYQTPSSETPMPSDLLAYKRAIEDELSRKLYLMFGHIPTVKITVNAVPDLSIRKIQEEKFDPKPVRAVLHQVDKETTSNDGTADGGEPGMKSNTNGAMGTADAGSGGHRTSSSTTDSSIDNTVKFPSTQIETVAPPGTELKDLTASISIPRSHFVSIYLRQNPKEDAKVDPTDEKLKPIIDAERIKVLGMAKNTIGAKSDDQIHVDWFDDTIAVRPVEMAAAGGLTGSSITSLASQYGKQLVLGAIAAAALGWMLMMIRGAVPAGAGTDVDPGAFFTGNAAAGKKRKGEPGQLDAADDIFGEANEGEAVLTGIELDDETLQSRKMVDEVSTMIKENPENAAALVKRWMAKSA